ncbi:MAG: glycine/sarcosine/betaine reductase complex component C subunit alpha [Eubacteriales bacterium]
MSMEKTVANIFLEMAHGLESGNYGSTPKIAVTGLGSEHGEQNVLDGAVLASKKGVDVHFIGSMSSDGITTHPVASEEEGHEKMESLLKSGEVDGVVTMHYPFPIGVSTVGRVVTPATGREMFVATTTGTSSTNRVEGMILNAIYGIITAKACGIPSPTVGILNVDGARQTEMALKGLQAKGYDFRFASSGRADGGAIMRGNDVLQASPDVMVTDPLTGNVLIKMLSAYSTGGSFEATGYGYGPGIGRGYEKLILIISRASGAPLIGNAMGFAAELVRGNLFGIAKAEFEKAESAGLKELLRTRSAPQTPKESETISPPPEEPCTASISGIEVMDLEDAASALWKEGVFAQTGMGCTGPIVMMSEKNLEKAEEILKKAGFIG